MKLLLLPVVGFLSLPLFVFAQGKVYSPLVDLSNAGKGNDVQTFESYINFLYGMSIAVAALLAVFKIIIAGTKYMLDDVISGKEDAKKDIQGAVLGLLLIISAVVILELINPTLVKKEIKFDPLPKRPDLTAPALTTAGGRTQTEQSAALAKGTDACLIISKPKVSNNGASTEHAASASTCGENVFTQLDLFSKNCAANGGKAVSKGTSSKIVYCTNTLAGATDAKKLTDTLTANFKNESKKDLSANLSQSGNVISLNFNTLCGQIHTETADNANYYAKQVEGCMKDGGYNGGFYKNNLKNECAEVYGKFGFSPGLATCVTPKIVKSATDFKGYNPKYPNATPETEADYKTACSQSVPNGVLFNVSDVANFDVDEYKCVGY